MRKIIHEAHPSLVTKKNNLINDYLYEGFSFKREETEVNGISPTRSSSWARLLSKVFGIDVLKCECGRELKPVSAIIKGDEIKRYLRHLGLDADPPSLEESETEDKSVSFSLFENSPYEGESFEVSSEEFPVINHD